LNTEDRFLLTFTHSMFLHQSGGNQSDPAVVTGWVDSLFHPRVHRHKNGCLPIRWRCEFLCLRPCSGSPSLLLWCTENWNEDEDCMLFSAL